jgi:hypothetical protein
MAKTGKLTATDASDLFSKVVSWLTSGAGAGQDWTIVKDYRQDAEPLERVVLYNNGLSGQEDVYIGLSNEIHSDNVNAGLCCRVYRYFDPDIHDFFDTTFGSRAGYGDTWGFVPYWNSQVDYWIWSNKQRIIVVIKTLDKYGCAYLGMIDRFMPPNEYQYPLVCLTDSMWESNWGTYIAYNELWSSRDSLYDFEKVCSSRNNFIRMMPEQDTSDSWSSYKCPACRCILRPDNIWTYRWRMCPTRTTVTGYGHSTTSSAIYGYGTQQAIYKEGEPVMTLPLYIYCYSNDGYKAILGQLDGVEYCPATFLSPESMLGSDYIVFPDINRTEWYRWMAIKDE